MNRLFQKVASHTSYLVGSPWAFIAALLMIAFWSLSGPLFHFSDTWQLVINTATTILTFLIVFLIQNTQNRDTKAIHIQLNELIRAIKNARNELIDAEDLSDQQLDELHHQFRALQKLHSKVCKDCPIVSQQLNN